MSAPELSLAGLASRKGYFLGVDGEAYPRDFAALKRYREALRALEPHMDLPPPCPLAAFEDALGRDPGRIRLEERRFSRLAATERRA